MKALWLRALVVTLLALGVARGAQAVSIAFFGEDIGSGDGTGIRLLNTPQADAARAGFFATLVPGITTEGFDGFAAGTPIASLPPITTIASANQVIRQPVPEPNTFILLGSGLILVGVLGWRRASTRR